MIEPALRDTPSLVVRFVSQKTRWAATNDSGVRAAYLRTHDRATEKEVGAVAMTRHASVMFIGVIKGGRAPRLRSKL